MSERQHLIHGTYDGYANHGCRCVNCTAAHTEYVYEHQRLRAHYLGPCTVEGCEIGQYARGLCKPHYERQRIGRPLTPIAERTPGIYRGKRYRRFAVSRAASGLAGDDTT